MNSIQIWNGIINDTIFIYIFIITLKVFFKGCNVSSSHTCFNVIHWCCGFWPLRVQSKTS